MSDINVDNIQVRDPEQYPSDFLPKLFCEKSRSRET